MDILKIIERLEQSNQVLTLSKNKIAEENVVQNDKMIQDLIEEYEDVNRDGGYYGRC